MTALNSRLLSKQEELRQFHLSKSKLIIGASLGVNKVFMEPEDILMAYRDNTVVYLVNRDHKRLISNLSLDALEDILPPYEFYRANRQFILTPDIIKSIRSGTYGKIELCLNVKKDTNVPSQLIVSRPSASGFRRWINRSLTTG